MKLSDYEIKAIDEFCDAFSEGRQPKDIVRDARGFMISLIQNICINDYKLSIHDKEFENPYYFITKKGFFSRYDTVLKKYVNKSAILGKVHDQIKFIKDIREKGNDYSVDFATPQEANQCKEAMILIFKWYFSNFKIVNFNEVINLSNSYKNNILKIISIVAKDETIKAKVANSENEISVNEVEQISLSNEYLSKAIEEIKKTQLVYSEKLRSHMAVNKIEILLEKAIILNKNNSDAWIEWGKLLKRAILFANYKDKFYDKAIDKFLRALEISPNNVNCLNEIAHLYLVKAEQNNKQTYIDSAIEFASKCLELDNEKYESYLYLGVAYYQFAQIKNKKENLQKSIEYLKYSCALNPENIEIKRNWCKSLRELCEIDDEYLDDLKLFVKENTDKYLEDYKITMHNHYFKSSWREILVSIFFGGLFWHLSSYINIIINIYVAMKSVLFGNLAISTIVFTILFILFTLYFIPYILSEIFSDPEFVYWFTSILFYIFYLPFFYILFLALNNENDDFMFSLLVITGGFSAYLYKSSKLVDKIISDELK